MSKQRQQARTTQSVWRGFWLKSFSSSMLHVHRFHARSAAMQVWNRHFLVAVQHICHLSTVTKCLNYGKYHWHINIILVFFPLFGIFIFHTCPTQPIPESIFLALVCLTPISVHVLTSILPQSILMLSLRFLVKKKVCLHPSSHDTTHSDAVIYMNCVSGGTTRILFATKEVRFCIRWCDGTSSRCA